MREADHLAEELLTFMGSVRVPWFTSLVQALVEVNEKYAEGDPSYGLNSIWAVVNHVSFWHDLVLRRLRGELTTKEEAIESGWSLPAHGGSRAWTHTQHELIARNAELAQFVRTLTADDLERPWYPGRPALRWQVIHGLLNHTSHHTADVLIARRILGIPLP